ncbi:MAG TPA: cytochrome c [Lacunisphaera sp.]|nr:cytochrome c [Lacunisphaera sp.]
MNSTLRFLTLGLALAGAAVLGRAASTQDNWDNSCASCHGEDGKGQTKQGKKLKVRDYTDPKVQAELKDDEMIKATAEGVFVEGKERMKAFKDEFTADEIKDLVAYIRKFKT